jgi:hypothetical protein
MSEITIVEDDDSGSIEEVAEVATEVAEAVSDAIIDAVEAVTEATEPATTSDETAIVVGFTMAEVAQLHERVDELEAQLAMTANTADLAVSLAVEAVEEPAPIVEEPTSPPPADEPPATTKTKFNDWFFGKKKS